MSYVQNYIKDRIVLELRNKLQTDLNIGSLYIKPFNVIQLNDVYLNDRKDSSILIAKKVYADLEILPLLNNQLVITVSKLSDFQVNLAKDSASAPLNIQFIIDAFKPKDDKKGAKFQVKIHSLNISDGRFRFDINDRPALKDKFDPNHINVSDLNAILSLRSLETDSLNIQIKKLTLQEKSGFKINNLIVRLITQENHLFVRGFKLELPKSLLQFEKCEIDYSSTDSTKKLIDKAIFTIKTSSSYIALKDIAAFVPAFKHFEERILFRTEIDGSLDSIRVSNLALDYGDKMHIIAKGNVNNVRDKEKLYLEGSVSNLTVTKDGVKGILNNLSGTKKELPPIFNNINTVSFHGNISGLLKQLKADGYLGTELGTITAKLDFGFNPNPSIKSFFKGNIRTQEFQLGNLLNNKDLENISLNLDININQPTYGKLRGSVDGLVDKFTFKKYTYNDIKLGGTYDGLRLNGGLSLNDENAILDLHGLFDLSDKEPKLNFDARLKNVRLDKLNLSNKYKESYLSVDVDANFSGKNIDDIQGYIKTDSVSFRQPDKSFTLDNFIIEASGLADTRKLSIKSDIINGEVTGAYSFTTIAESVKRSLNAYLPALIDFNEKKKSNIKSNDLSFDFTINNTEKASDIFQLPVTIYSPTKIIGFYNNQTERFKIETYLPSIKAAGTKIQSGYLLLENNNEEIKSTISGTFVTKNGTLNNLSTDIRVKNDVVNIHTLFLNKEEGRLKGEFANSIAFSKPDKKTLQTDIRFQAGELILNNTLWKIKNSNIRIIPNKISVDNFVVTSENKDQQLSIDGTFSAKDPDEKLHVQLRNIDLDYIFNTLSISALQFGGSASGDLALSTIDGQPYANINLKVHDFAFNSTKLGDLDLFSDLDAETKKVNLKGTITNPEDKLTNIDGFINPLTQELSINFDAKEIDVAFLNKYVASLFNGIKGKGSGNVHLFGDFSNVTVEGEAFIENGSLGINFLNTNYSFTDTIYMKKDLIYFNDIAFHDEKGNTAMISGKVVHDYFTNFLYYVDLVGDNFMLYNATQKLNPMFYGTVFGSGSGVIKGDERAVDINVNMQTNSNTNIYMNFMEDKASEYSFIRYKTKEEVTDSIKNPNEKPKFSRLQTDSGIEINMNFYIDATPDATVELLMDPVGGDRLRGSGTGALQFTWGTNKEPMLYGTYMINKGSYNFTFQKIFERKFTIQDGSFVQFRGDPFEANIDLTAIYRVIANLNDLDQNIAKNTGQASVPVNCILNITGALRQPKVNLDIALPSADPEVQRQIKSLISTEDMINRQIVYLLLLSKFYTPNYAMTDQKTSDLAAVASATLSTQLSNILSQLDDRWQVGTNIRTSDAGFSSTEVELILSSRLLNDRVLFNGNFGYRDNPMTQDAFIGDVDIEVLLNRIGTWRLKAYNHYNEKYYYVGAGGSGNGVQTQGVGILYKRDFDYLRELFTRPKKKGQPLQPDSTKRQDTVKHINQIVKMK
ncbi:translocation/assembly module TamB domain-containing protein [Dysgonomonas sp. GY617]|uniref:translocation/assembly module TamB domain-containing protein n=1 Tax=Dysgonomonas sp. GY617 TaxID=2780420 RepID=UPI00188432EB|nr:translocation/assembly module TamB domain-containing protein [Dysgonomonas sp. GY617]MBF0576786.1 translocation/assembly module TamB [Dysgonomonas sp. GY617]